MASEVEGYLFLCVVYHIFARWWRGSVVCQHQDERGVLCGCGPCVLEITSCGLVYVQYHSIISSCRRMSIDYGGMVQPSVK